MVFLLKFHQIQILNQINNTYDNILSILWDEVDFYNYDSYADMFHL